jgi:hypothetical protein
MYFSKVLVPCQFYFSFFRLGIYPGGKGLFFRTKKRQKFVALAGEPFFSPVSEY